MDDAEIVRRLFFSLISALCIVFIASVFIGPQNKAKWFKLRDMSKGFWFFNRRGILGETLRFGWPKTQEGFKAAGVMIAMIALTTYIIFLI